MRVVCLRIFMYTAVVAVAVAARLSNIYVVSFLWESTLGRYSIPFVVAVMLLLLVHSKTYFCFGCCSFFSILRVAWVLEVYLYLYLYK